MSSGAEREIATVRSLLDLSVSPDGRTLALADVDRSAGVSRLLTVPSSGGDVRELYRAESLYAIEPGVGIPWTPDGRHIVFVSDEEPGAAWKISSAGGAPQRLVDLPGSYDWRHLRFHPDGSRIAYTSGEWRAEVWMIRNIPGVGRRSAAGSTR